jgi:hypothetical protein
VLIEMYSKVFGGTNLLDIAPVKNRLTQGEALSSWVFSFALECTLKKVQKDYEDWN